jgi:hypothetical protein
VAITRARHSATGGKWRIMALVSVDILFLCAEIENDLFKT